MKKIIIFSITLMLLFAGAGNALCQKIFVTATAVKSGLWSSPDTWDTGSVPNGDDEEVLIPAGITVTNDKPGVEVLNLLVYGTFNGSRGIKVWNKADFCGKGTNVLADGTDIYSLTVGDFSNMDVIFVPQYDIIVKIEGKVKLSSMTCFASFVIGSPEESKILYRGEEWYCEAKNVFTKGKGGDKNELSLGNVYMMGKYCNICGTLNDISHNEYLGSKNISWQEYAKSAHKKVCFSFEVYLNEVTGQVTGTAQTGVLQSVSKDFCVYSTTPLINKKREQVCFLDGGSDWSVMLLTGLEANPTRPGANYTVLGLLPGQTLSPTSSNMYPKEKTILFCGEESDMMDETSGLPRVKDTGASVALKYMGNGIVEFVGRGSINTGNDYTEFNKVSSSFFIFSGAIPKNYSQFEFRDVLLKNVSGMPGDFASRVTKNLAVSGACGATGDVQLAPTATFRIRKASDFTSVDGIFVNNTNPAAIVLEETTGLGGITCPSMTWKMNAGTNYTFPIKDNFLKVQPETAGSVTVATVEKASTLEGHNLTKAWGVTSPSVKSAKFSLSRLSGDRSSECDVVYFDPDKGNWVEPRRSSSFVNNFSTPAVACEIFPEGSYVAYWSTDARISWTGDVDKQWANTNNWYPKRLPSASESVVIPNGCKNYPLITQKDPQVFVGEVLVEDEAMMTIDCGRITTREGIVMKGDRPLQITNRTTKMGSIRSNVYSRDRGAGYVEVKRYFRTPRTFHTSTAVINCTYSKSSNSQTEWRGYDPVNEGWVLTNDYLTRTSNVTFRDVKVTRADSLIQRGNLMPYEEYTYSLSDAGRGWNYITNPFHIAFPLGQANAAGAFHYSENVNPSMWFMLTDATKFYYGIYNLVANAFVGPSDGAVELADNFIMHPFQNFFVQVDGPLATFSIDPTVNFALPDPNNVLYKSAQVHPEQLRVAVRTMAVNSVDEVVLSFNEGGSLSSSKLDSYKMEYNKEYNSIFSVRGDKNVAIAICPAVKDLAAEQSFPLGFRLLGTGNVKGVISSRNAAMFDKSMDVYLCDAKTGEQFDLRSGDYEFVDKAGVENIGRFSILLLKNANDEGTVTDIVAADEARVSVSAQGGAVLVEADTQIVEEGATASVYDLRGTLVARKRLSSTSEAIAVSANGIYVVDVTSATKSVKEKVLVK